MTDLVADAEPRQALRAVALGLFDAIDAHPWVGGQLTREPWRPALLDIYEIVSEQLQALGVPQRALCRSKALPGSNSYYRGDGEVERMEPISLILAAIVAGASAGSLDALKDDVREKVKAAYAKLHGLIKKRVAGRPDAELALERYPGAPKKWEPVLTDELTQAGAAGDTELVAAAKALMELVDQAGAKSGKYNVTIKDSKGVQVGDGGFQVNTFNG